MPLSLQQVLKQLDTDEPNYMALAALGPEAVPHLSELVRGDDAGLASKAAYLASLIESDESMEVLASAAASPHDAVRVAAAAGLRNVTSPRVVAVADRLLDDDDPGVRKLALRAVAQGELNQLEPKVRAMASKDAVGSLRQLASDALKRIGTGARKTTARKPARQKRARSGARKTRSGARKK